MIEKFGMASLATIDGGRIKVAFEQALRRCSDDCEDRPATDDARKVVLTAELVPQCDDMGAFSGVDVKFHIKDSQPVRRSATFNMKSNKGNLLFNEMSPKDIHQATIDDATQPTLVEGDKNAG